MPGVRGDYERPFYLSISGERYFHVLDPDGHELSFATPQYSHPRWAASAESSGALDAAAEELKAEQQEQPP
jgi:hypothetical protein